MKRGKGEGREGNKGKGLKRREERERKILEMNKKKENGMRK